MNAKEHVLHEVIDTRRLTAEGLPIDGVLHNFSSFFVVDDGGKIVGAAGLELYGKYALLRSVVVCSIAKGRGAGMLLPRRAIDEASARAARAICLLTTTAFFPRFGFERITREDVPETVRVSRVSGCVPSVRHGDAIRAVTHGGFVAHRRPSFDDTHRCPNGLPRTVAANTRPHRSHFTEPRCCCRRTLAANSL